MNGNNNFRTSKVGKQMRCIQESFFEEMIEEHRDKCILIEQNIHGKIKNYKES